MMKYLGHIEHNSGLSLEMILGIDEVALDKAKLGYVCKVLNYFLV